MTVFFLVVLNFLSQSSGLLLLAEENHIKDIMEALEPVNAARSYLNTLTSKQVRLGFFGMTRKDPSQPLDTLLG